MRQTTTLALMSAAALTLIACQGNIESKPVEGAPKAPSSYIPGHEPLDPAMTEEGLREHVGIKDKGAGVVTPLPTEQVRLRRRLDLDQLDASIRRVSGGIGWTEMRNGQEINLFEDLASTMGKPDFINSTSEDLDPSIIFQKFLGDAARTVCDRVMEREVALAPGQGERSLFITISPNEDPRQAKDKAEQNIKALMLRFHGRYLGPEDDHAQDPRFKSWSWLLESSLHTGSSPAHAWRAVCVGMMTHPDFYMY